MNSKSDPRVRSRLGAWRYSLRGIWVFLSLVAVSLGIARLITPVWGGLFLAYVVLAVCFLRSPIRLALWLPLSLAALHTILITIAAVIDSASAWDDMSPTMLVLIAVYVFDFPIHFAFQHIGLFPTESWSWYPAQLVATGGMLWFGAGLLLRLILSLAAKLVARHK